MSKNIQSNIPVLVICHSGDLDFLQPEPTPMQVFSEEINEVATYVFMKPGPRLILDLWGIEAYPILGQPPSSSLVLFTATPCAFLPEVRQVLSSCCVVLSPQLT